MKRVLLAIDGIRPDQNVFQYAVDLCRRIRTELNIFQIIRPALFRLYRDRLKKKGKIVRNLFEEAMVAATFAEANEHKLASEVMERALKESRYLLQASEKAGVQCQFSLRSGNPGKEIVEYVRNHRDVVLTIYDADDAGLREIAGQSVKDRTLTRIKKSLPIPVVTVRH